MSLWKKRRVRLKKEAFARLRTKVFQRDRWRCRNPYCRSPRNLTVHHLVKRSQGGSDHIDNLITLCWACHEQVERRLIKLEATEGASGSLSFAKSLLSRFPKVKS
ncbi:HNH endonuclease [Nitrospinae bacterium AH_259_B05_G02_I21]|nr:HNH endonuclease [Nitrospinae bacterium AH_259_B05_G02_I21]MDA2932364.1 HNH endonuclease [Nitrospinae bacterium AH-259-F20]